MRDCIVFSRSYWLVQNSRLGRLDSFILCSPPSHRSWPPGLSLNLWRRNTFETLQEIAECQSMCYNLRVLCVASPEDAELGLSRGPLG